MNPIIKFAIYFLTTGFVFSFCKKEKNLTPVLMSPPSVIKVQLIPVGTLSKSRSDVSVATAGNKILFAEGTSGDLPSSVDIYDIITKSWSTAELSEARMGIGTVTVGNKILFAGGAKSFDYDQGYNNFSKRVDIYDVSNNSWTRTELPEAGYFLYGIATVAGNRAFFYSGHADPVYVYDVFAKSWSTAQLSEPRAYLAATSVGSKILIAGGFNYNGDSKKVDIYDASTDSWSVDTLSEARSFLKAATLKNKAFFAGGQSYPYLIFTSKVDIYDNATQSWSIAHLSRATQPFGAASLGERIFFFYDSRLDIYDVSTDTWSIADLTQSFSHGSKIIAAAEGIYLTNGSQVWQVQF